MKLTRSQVLSVLGAIVAILGAISPTLAILPPQYSYVSIVVTVLGAATAAANRSLLSTPGDSSKLFTVIGVAMAVVGAITPYLDLLPARFNWASVVCVTAGAALAAVNKALRPERPDAPANLNL